MGIIIESAATFAQPRHAARLGSLALATRAAKRAIARAGREAGDVRALVNASVFPEGFVVEPASAAFIQRDLGTNPRARQETQAFSFDLNAGACGALTAIEVLKGFLTSERDLGLVVVGDADPTPGVSSGYAYEELGGAILLASGPPGAGFLAHRTQSFPEYEDHISARGLPTVDPSTNQPAGCFALVVEEKPDTREAVAVCVDQAATRFLNDLGNPRIDLVIAPQLDAFQVSRIAGGKLQGARCFLDRGDTGRWHASGLIAGIDETMQTGVLGEAERTLMLTVGSGLTVSTTLYRGRTELGR